MYLSSTILFICPGNNSLSEAPKDASMERPIHTPQVQPNLAIKFSSLMHIRTAFFDSFPNPLSSNTTRALLVSSELQRAILQFDIRSFVLRFLQRKCNKEVSTLDHQSIYFSNILLKDQTRPAFFPHTLHLRKPHYILYILEHKSTSLQLALAHNSHDTEPHHQRIGIGSGKASNGRHG